MPRRKIETVATPAVTEVRSARARINVPAQSNTNYFADSSERTELEFFTTGCMVLDQVMGGGYVLGRMTNIIGDKSTGKSLLGEESIINFKRKWSNGRIRFAEAESALDKLYAKALGVPIDQIEWVNWDYSKEGRSPKEITAIGFADGDNDRTVEHWYEDMLSFIDSLNGEPGLYILDSLDALSSRDELARGISDASYGQEKAKKIGELFRRLIGTLEKSRVCLIVISQIRDKIGVTFGETKMRTGGHAMDFYATHCLWLAHTGNLKRTVAKIERTVGVSIRAKCKKNKVGVPHRECDFNIMFGYGIDDIEAACTWLVEAGREERLAEVGFSKAGYKLGVQGLRSKGGPEIQRVRSIINKALVEEWRAVETTFLPSVGKY